MNKNTALLLVVPLTRRFQEKHTAVECILVCADEKKKLKLIDIEHCLHMHWLYFSCLKLVRRFIIKSKESCENQQRLDFKLFPDGNELMWRH